jgi:hypothetical protein
MSKKDDDHITYSYGERGDAEELVATVITFVGMLAFLFKALIGLLSKK